MKKPKLSIIVPVYNVEKYIERCIKSILNQTFSDFELIIVNDGSIDNSGVICDKYKKVDARVKVIHKQNGGLSEARNIGLNIAQGDYIAFVDSDDYINRNMYEILYKNTIKYNADIAVCNIEYVNEKEFINESSEISIEECIVYDNIQSLNNLYSNENIQFIIAVNKLYRRDIFKKIRYQPGKYHEDEFIIHELLYKSNIIIYCKSKLYYYLQRSGSIMTSSFNTKKLDAIEAMEKRMNFFREKGLIDLEYKTQNMFLYYFFPYYYKTKYELKDNKNLEEMEKRFKNNYKYLLKNKNYNLRAKILWGVFIINPSIFYTIFNIRNS